MIRFLSIDYYRQKFRAPPRDAHQMTREERLAERKRLIDRVNALCAADKQPPQYFIMTQEEFAKLSKSTNPKQPTH